MGLLSPYTLIRTISLLHLTAAYFFLTNPARITDQNVVYMLGESMHLPHATTFTKPSEASTFVAILLSLFAVSDFTAAGLDQLVALEYWLANVPVRLAVMFAVTGYSWVGREGGYLGPEPGLGSFRVGLGSGGLKGGMGVRESVCNSLVFSWGFFEMCAWFWVFTSLRDERTAVAKKILEHRKAEEDRL
ncbi:hypothetical protein B0A48_07220 [Cryoendolithus antarcticus]|uniref:Increased loss of mitochondrial DNA protein 1 n=1 Tax=Cryoendolithus antarcticus TaxID=1507870 RepID=A0A1V8T7Z1_9PEZI|nr:hypothetical protein B0A48_07220 [Cryoendolithus antarcticus]